MASGGRNEISPTIPSGFPRYRNQMFLGFVVFSFFYFAVAAKFDSINQFLKLPPSAEKLCPDGPCWRGDLFSFEIVSGIALMWCGLVGFWAWHVKGIHKSVPQTPEGRLFGYIPEAHLLTAVGTTFQVFDLFVSILIPEMRKPEFLCHHIMAATVSWYGLNNQVSNVTTIVMEIECMLCFVVKISFTISTVLCACSCLLPVLSLLWNLLFGMLRD
jgi:hypothetical protein